MKIGYAGYARYAGYTFAFVLLVFSWMGCRAHSVAGPRVIVLGFDGLDYGLTQELMAQGRMPNFSRVAASGGFAPLGTSIPPQSPVAWSTFITGLDPGGHGIFDFVHRDPKTSIPYLSTTRTEAGGRKITLGGWQFPLSSGRVELLRHGQPFWEALESRGIETSILRMPANFPPSGTATRELSGMGTPDILGTYGQFSFFTSDASAFGGTEISGGTVYRVDASHGVVNGTLEGPDQPYLTKSEKMRASFVAYVDETHQFAKIVIGAEQRVLQVGEWSDWVPIAFEIKPWQSLPAECRFYVKQLTPNFELYVSPVNLDPMAPAVPISGPSGYASELARATGRFYTQGMPEDTKSLKTGVLSTAEFLAQARIAQAENLQQFHDVLSRFDRGLLFYYFGNVDQVSHMLWRARDPQHPAYNAATDAPFAHVIDDLYAEFDAIVGETLQRLGPDDLLVVMSDHGFASWRRSFNLTTWLKNEGYQGRAYGLGLNGLYINLKGREISGTVDPSQRDALANEIREKLLRTVDPDTGQPAITKVYRREQVYSAGGFDDIAPDLIVGYAKGTRVSDDSALGVSSPTVFANNTSAWSGDHCMDPDSVPGIVLTNRKLKKPAASLQTLAATILAELGVDGFPKK